MKRILIVTISITVLVFLVAVSWAKSPKTKKPVYKFHMALAFPAEETPRYSGAVHFAEEVEKRTGGQVNIKLSPVGEIVTIPEAIPALKAGTIEILVFANAFYLGETWAAYWNMVPGLCENYKFAETEEKSGVFDLLRGDLRKAGLEMLGNYEVGAADVFIAKKHHFTVPQDLKGLKIRGFGGPHDRSFADFGAKAVTLPMDELYMALQTGVADGAFTALPAYEGFRWYEVAPKVTYIPSMPFGFSITFNKKVWDGLSTDIQSAIRAAMKDTQSWILPEKRAYYAAAFPRLIGLGVDFKVPPIEAWTDDYGLVVRKHYRKMGGDAAKKVLELLGKE